MDARFTPASSADADATAGDTLNNADNATIDYDKIAADAADIHNSSLAAFDRIVNNLKVLDSNRAWRVPPRPRGGNLQQHALLRLRPPCELRQHR